MGVSRQCAHRWLARFDAEGLAGLHDRSSRPGSCPTRTPAEVEVAVLACRDAQRIGRDRVAELTGVAARTVSRILTRHGRLPLAVLDPVTGMGAIYNTERGHHALGGHPPISRVVSPT
jgi:leucine-zipper of insertion element IS481